MDKKPVAIITGISRGFGKAVAEVLLLANWQVVGDGRNPKILKETVASLKSKGTIEGIPGDITNQSHLKTLSRKAQSLGNLKLVVNNAGTLGPTPLPKLTDLKIVDLGKTLQINTFAPLQLIQISLPLLKDSKGVVINITSDAATGDYPTWGAYSITKVALEKLTSLFAQEEPSVRFYSLDPGDMQTDMHQAAYPGEDISNRPEPAVSAPAVIKLAEGKLPSGRYRAIDLIEN